MPVKHLPKVTIIGAGTVGSTLASALFEKGYPIVSIISRTACSAITLAKTVKCKKASTNVADIDKTTGFVLIAVSDRAIADVASQLMSVKKLKLRKLFIAHTSGVHSSRVLDPLEKKGALVASIHPIQTFPASHRTIHLRSKLRGIFYGIEGNAAALQRAESIVADLDGKSIIVPRELKPLYHVVCVFASGYMMVFLNTISELSKVLKLNDSWTNVFGPLMTTAMENTVKQSARVALTGPLVRNDLPTIDIHLETLAHHAPQFLPLYTVAAIETARIARESKRIDQREFNDILTHIRAFVKSNSFVKISKVKR